MLKFLFFDNRDYELMNGFTRRIEQPKKHPANPLFGQDRPWEHNITLYGSAVKVPGRPFQLWYTIVEPPFHLVLAYAESDDGINWHKPEFDIYLHQGRRTNVVFAADPHGAAILYDDADSREDWKYKMVCGIEPKGMVHAFHSADGIHWLPARDGPIIGNHPDCPMSLVRRLDGSYAAHHRVPGGGRRIGRSESTDFIDWRGGRIVLEPGPGDPCQYQMYGMGDSMYGDYEIGTLWNYATDLDDMGRAHMNGRQQAEFVYSRSGLAWHRAAPHELFIPAGAAGDWDSGNVQCASAPVFLDNEIRYYYASSPVRHSMRWELQPGRFGIGCASTKPDRFVALAAGSEPATLVTRQFIVRSPEIYVNADIAPTGHVRLELLDADGQTLPAFELDACMPLAGDEINHRVRWHGQPDPQRMLNRPIRLRLRAENARVFSVWMPDGDSTVQYNRFQSPSGSLQPPVGGNPSMP
jgi:hypothetical protein